MDTTNNSGQSFGKQPPKIADLLSAPLVAAASANSYMVREQTRFLLDTCFVTKGPNLYEPLMIEMSLSKSLLTEDENHVLNRQDIVSTFKVPLLTLVPFNSLVVDNVDIDFSMEIVSYSANTSTSTTKEEKSETGNSSGSNEPVLTGKLSYDANDKSESRSHNASKLNVKLHAGTIPLPPGLTTLIDMYVKSISAVPNQ